VLCTAQKLLLNPSLSNASFLWQDGSTAGTYEVKNPGLYWAKATVNGCRHTDSIVVSYKPLPVLHLGKDTSICTNQTLLLKAYDPSIQSYTWSDGSTQPALLVNEAGTYSVQVMGTNGCSHRDTIKVSSIPLPDFSLGKDTLLCEGRRLELDYFLAGAAYQWSTGSSSNALTISQPGLYWLQVTQNGCSKRDSVEVTYKPLLPVSLGRDTTLCEGNSKLLDVTNSNATYQWQDYTRFYKHN
jgi:hypothetical protein